MLKVAKDLSLPIETAAQATVLVGLRGSGKTNTAGVIVEELLDAGQPVAVIDPTDVWWGLRSSADGRKAGYPVLVIGGPHGQLPLEETAGKTIAQFIVEERAPVILSLRHLRKAAQRRFVCDLAEELYHLKGRVDRRQPLTVVLDEAPLFIPQDVRGDVAHVVGAIEDLVARGRAAGFGVVIISQRFATVNKNVSTQADTIICHRQTGKHDRVALKDWIEANATIEEQTAVLASLAGLKNGEAWLWAPSVDIFRRVQIRLKRTFDSSATPKIGQVAATPKKLAEVDLDALKGKLSASIEKAKADDPKELRKRIADLESRLNKTAKPVQDQAAIDKAVGSAVAARDAYFQSLIDARDKWVVELRAKVKEATGILNAAAESLLAVPGLKVISPPLPTRDSRARGKLQPRRQNPPVRGADQAATSSGLSRMQREFLTALAQQPEGLEKGRLLAITGYSSNGSTSATFAQFVADGWSEMPRPAMLRITDAGLAALGKYEPLPSGAELRKLRLNHRGLTTFEKRCLEICFESYPEPVRKGQILELAGYSSNGSTSAGFAKLAKIGWLEKSGAGELKASDIFFE